MASAFGLNPDRSVLGAFAGNVDWSSTATTCGPASTAKSISVAEGESETIRSGRFAKVTLPTVTGYEAPPLPDGAGPPSPPVAASR